MMVEISSGGSGGFISLSVLSVTVALPWSGLPATSRGVGVKDEDFCDSSWTSTGSARLRDILPARKSSANKYQIPSVLRIARISLRSPVFGR